MLGQECININEEKDENEVTLSAVSRSCFPCKKNGHRVNKCPEKGEK
jgi:hypothetical protein